MEYYLKAGLLGGIFAVPNTVVDNFIKLANEASVKVLLYVLRHNEQPLSSKSIADALSVTESQVEEAFVFWENANVFSKTGSATAAQAASAEAPEPPKRAVQLPDRPEHNMSPSEIAERVNGSEDVKNLFAMSEYTLGHPLNHTEQRNLIWMHDNLGLPAEVIIMIISYSLKAEKYSVNYVVKVAADWAEREINTLELAQEELKELEERMSYNYSIMRIFGMNRKPTTKQQAFIDEWKEKAYSMDLIEYAYEKTIEAIEKLNFSYINKILVNWYTNGLLTKALIDGADRERSEKKEYSFDLDEYKGLANNFGDLL